MDSQKKENMKDFVFSITKMEILSMGKLLKERKKGKLQNSKIKNNNGSG